MGEDLVMGRFRLGERLGSGGMGTVYRGFDERLQREVAIKEVLGSDPGRVLREAQAAARLNHPGIVTLYELGERNGRALLVSELVAGDTLAQLHRAGELCDRDIAEVGAGLCEALTHAHDRGVVHRDIKPQNVIVPDERGFGRRAKLMDFGVARIAGAPTLTAAGEVVGTLSYMSPEQAEGRRAGAESDVYSLALTAYECWSGINPVAGETPAETARRIGSEIAPLRVHRPDLPAGMAETIDACLDPDPQLRPTAAELRDCLEAEAAKLDGHRSLPAPEAGGENPAVARRRLGLARVATLVCVAAALTLIAGPLGAGGAALVIAVLCLPALAVGAPAAALAAPFAPLLVGAGIGSASAVLAVAAPTPLSRAILGAGTWAWLLAGSLALGFGPELGIAAQAPDGWASDPSVAADAVLRPLLEPGSLLGAAVFALAALTLGWLLALRHASVALLLAMLWTAGVDAALAVVGNGALGGNPVGVVAAAAIAVAIEFGVLRGGARAPSAATGPRPLTT